MKRLALLLLLMLACALPSAADQIAAVSFSSLALATPGATGPSAIHPLGAVFNTAGLVYAGGILYGIANDGSGGFTLNALDLTGQPVDVFGGSSWVTLATDPGSGWSGLAFSAGHFYSLLVNSSGSANLVRLNGSGSVDEVSANPLQDYFVPFPGGSGLAFAGSTLYGISTDSWGVSTLLPIDLTSGVLGPGMWLGEGFSGGLAYGRGRFFAVRNDFLGYSYLDSFQLSGPLTEGGELGVGASGYFGGLAFVPETVPEPNTVLLVAVGLAGIALPRIRRKR